MTISPLVGTKISVFKYSLPSADNVVDFINVSTLLTEMATNAVILPPVLL